MRCLKYIPYLFSSNQCTPSSGNVRGRAVSTPLMQNQCTPSSRAGTAKGVSNPYTPTFTSGIDGTYPTYYPGGKTIAELQKTPSPLKKRKRKSVTPYWEPEAKRFLSTEQELSMPFPLATPEVPRLSEEFGPMPTIAVDLPSEHVVPSQPEGNTTPIMVEVDQTRRTPQTSTVALQTRNKATGSKPNPCPCK